MHNRELNADLRVTDTHDYCRLRLALRACCGMLATDCDDDEQWCCGCAHPRAWCECPFVVCRGCQTL